jgi:hypothetical protein
MVDDGKQAMKNFSRFRRIGSDAPNVSAAYFA